MNAHRPCPFSLRCLALLFVLVICLESAFSGVLNINADFPGIQTPPDNLPGIIGLKVDLKAENGKTTIFQPGQATNDQPIPQIPDQPREIPFLIRDKNGTPTSPSDRTLLIFISRIAVPSGGATVTLEIQTMHNDPDAINQMHPILVRVEQVQLPNPGPELLKNQRADFRIEFSDTLPSPTGINFLTTPTDYYQVRVSVNGKSHQGSKPKNNNVGALIQEYTQEYAFLLEDQWSVMLPPVLESTPGAAPRKLLLHTCDMFLPHKNQVESGARLTRLNFSEMVEKELIPWLIAIYQQESKVWGFNWHPEWTSQRSEDGLENLSVALEDGITWYHGPSAPLGNSSISIALTRRDSQHYDLIPDQVKTTFAHELFHNLQRSIILHYQGKANLDGLKEAWEFFSEGTAVLASTVSMTGLEFGNILQEIGYLSHANYYISSFDTHVGLESLNSYQAGLYWRFLYEQCGGMTNGQEDPAAGMEIVNKSLEVLYQEVIVDIHTSIDLLIFLAPIMDQSLSESNCPFHSFNESLLGFARVINSLRWLAGRELYDPNLQYHLPPAISITYSGETIRIDEQAYPKQASIPDRYGFDLVEIKLESSVKDLEITFQPMDLQSTFSVQALGYGKEKTWEILAIDQSEPGMNLTFRLDAVKMRPYEWMNLIIIRLDAARQESKGEYSLVVSP